MRAWQFVREHEPLAHNEVPEPVAGPGQVVLDVMAAGICHTDVGFLDGTLTWALPDFRPMTLGHEIAGVVSEVGPGVEAFAVGDRVAVPALVEGPGGSSDGGFADRVLVDAEKVVPLPDGVDWAQAAAATDAGMTSYHAVMTRGGVRPGMRVGIVGLGGVGSLGAQAAIVAGAEVFVAERNEDVHAYARELGATEVAADVTAFAGDGLELIVDFAGFGTTTAGAIDTVAPGGRVVQVGLGRRESTIDLFSLVFKRVELLGSLVGTQEDCAAVFRLIAEGRMSSRIVPVSFDEIGTAIERLARGEVRGRLVAVR